MVRLPRNEKQTYWLISRPQMWPSGLTLDMTLTLNFQGQIWNWLYLCQKWSDCHKTKSKHIDWTLGLKCDHHLTLAVTLTLNFQGEIWIFIYLNQNWPDSHETKSKHIDLNSRPQIWPMDLTLAMTLIFEFWRSYVILTIWWPRSGVRIYQIVTGVTSDVGVPSTHLVFSWDWGSWWSHTTISRDMGNSQSVWIVYMYKTKQNKTRGLFHMLILHSMYVLQQLLLTLAIDLTKRTPCLTITGDLWGCLLLILGRKLTMRNWVCSELCLQVTDFGLSKFVDCETMMKTFCGTPNYLAPEVLLNKGSGAYTNAVDVWSLGVILFIWSARNLL